jgi:hypothetical protein
MAVARVTNRGGATVVLGQRAEASELRATLRGGIRMGPVWTSSSWAFWSTHTEVRRQLKVTRVGL